MAAAWDAVGEVVAVSPYLSRGWQVDVRYDLAERVVLVSYMAAEFEGRRSIDGLPPLDASL